MKESDTIENQPKKESKRSSVHHVLAHSYLVYFVAFLLGLVLDFAFPIRVLKSEASSIFGFVLLFFGTLLIFWAQKTSSRLNTENISKESFNNGPYKYTRSPTHYGLYFSILGFGILVNAFFIIILATISFIITKFHFIKKQEELLAKKYGEHYLEYQKSVKF